MRKIYEVNANNQGMALGLNSGENISIGGFTKMLMFVFPAFCPSFVFLVW